MSGRNEPDDPRRRVLVQALAAGPYLLGAGTTFAQSDGDGLFGKIPEKLPATRSFYSVDGNVQVNGKLAQLTTRVNANDQVTVEHGGRATFVVGKDAFMLQDEADLTLSGTSNVVVDGLRLLSGKLLSVFGKSRHQLNTPSATIGIRGTGIYTEAEPGRSYICTCYGITTLAATDDPSSAETIESRHHDAPRYILAAGNSGQRIQPAPFKNRSDMELALLEALVGRETPFGFAFDQYGLRRKTYAP